MHEGVAVLPQALYRLTFHRTIPYPVLSFPKAGGFPEAFPAGDPVNRRDAQNRPTRVLAQQPYNVLRQLLETDWAAAKSSHHHCGSTTDPVSQADDSDSRVTSNPTRSMEVVISRYSNGC